MKCPLFYAACISKDLEGREDEDDCLNGECAWWDTTLKTCAVSRIANRLDQITYFWAKVVEPVKGSIKSSLVSIASSLRDIASKTPLGGK